MKHPHFYLLPKEQPFPRGKMFHRPICSQMKTTKFLAWELFVAEVSTLCFGRTAPSTAGQISRHHPNGKHKRSCWSGLLLMSPRGCYIVHKKNGELGGDEKREKEISLCWRREERQRWDGKDRRRASARGAIPHLLLPDSFHLHYHAPEQLILLFSRKRNNVPQVKELSWLFSFSAKLTLGTWNKGYLEK